MIGRVLTLLGYSFKRILTSSTGILLFISAVALWLVFFSPWQGRVPESSLFILLIGVYGIGIAFLSTLYVASHAYRAEHAALFVRLPSRIEYMLAVVLTGVLFTTIIQLLLAVVIRLQPLGPDIPLAKLLEIPPVWISADLLAAVFALHASDLVNKGWSRTFVFGTLMVLLFSQSVDGQGVLWIVNWFNGVAMNFTRQNSQQLANTFQQMATWFSANGYTFLRETVGFPFWPLRSISDAVLAGAFDNAQALSPAILILYATILFMLAADWLGTKDLQLLE